MPLRRPSCVLAALVCGCLAARTVPSDASVEILALPRPLEARHLLYVNVPSEGEVPVGTELDRVGYGELDGGRVVVSLTETWIDAPVRVYGDAIRVHTREDRFYVPRNGGALLGVERTVERDGELTAISARCSAHGIEAVRRGPLGERHFNLGPTHETVEAADPEHLALFRRAAVQTVEWDADLAEDVSRTTRVEGMVDGGVLVVTQGREETRSIFGPRGELVESRQRDLVMRSK